MKRQTDKDHILSPKKTRGSRRFSTPYSVSSSIAVNHRKISPVKACNTAQSLRQDQITEGTFFEKDTDTMLRKYRRDKMMPRNQRQEHHNSRLPTRDDSKKDKHSNDGNESDGGDGDSDRALNENVYDANSSKPLFACPFYKHDSIRYMSCVRLRLTRIRDVKQHLNRRHRRPIHCETCGAIFRCKIAREGHVVAKNCVSPPGGFVMEAFTKEQSTALGRRVHRGLDGARQWFSIWEILFPNSPRPSSAYLKNNFEETLCMIQNYWQTHGDELIVEATGPSYDPKEVSSRALEILILRFCASSQAVMDPASSNPMPVDTADFDSSGLEIGTDAKPSFLPETLPPPRVVEQQTKLRPRNDTAMSLDDRSGSIPWLLTSKSISPTISAISQSPNEPSTTTTIAVASNQGLSFHSTNSVCSTPYEQVPSCVDVFANNTLNTLSYHRLPLEDPLTSMDHFVSIETAFTGTCAWLDSDLGTDMLLESQFFVDEAVSTGLVSCTEQSSFSMCSEYEESKDYQDTWHSFSSKE
jgi:hypothetical protein